MNKKYLIFGILTLLFLISRFYNLKDAPLWEDNFSWHYRMNYYPWVLETNLKGTNEPQKNLKHAGEISYHPGVTLMSLSGASSRFGKKILTYQDPGYVLCGFKEASCKYYKTEILIAKIPLILLFSGAFFSFLVLIEKKFNLVTAIIFSAFILFEPFLYLTSRDLHLDYLQTIFAVLAYLVLYKSQKYSSAVLSGFFLGLALLTRFPSIFFVPGLFLVAGVSKKGVKNFIVLLSAAVITFCVLYPPMWKYPINTINYIVQNSRVSTTSHITKTARMNKVRYFSGIVTYGQETIRFMSPVWYLGLIPGFAAIAILEKDPKNKKAILLFSLGFVIYILLINISDKKFFRYIVPSVVGLTIPISYGIYLIADKVRSKYA